jgi:hypothetical protein
MDVCSTSLSPIFFRTKVIVRHLHINLLTVCSHHLKLTNAGYRVVKALNYVSEPCESASINVNTVAQSESMTVVGLSPRKHKACRMFTEEEKCKHEIVVKDQGGEAIQKGTDRHK